MFKTTSRYLAIAVTSLAVTAGAAGIAYAQMPPGGGQDMHGGPGMQHGWHGGMHHGRGHHMMQELNEVHAMLNLNASQEQKWQTALSTMKQGHETARANHEQMLQQMKSIQSQPILDLNAMHAQHEKIEAQDHQLREQTEAAWLNFYGSLDNQQKTIVSTVLKERMAKMEERHEHMQKMHERWEQHQKGASGASAANPS